MNRKTTPEQGVGWPGSAEPSHLRARATFRRTNPVSGHFIAAIALGIVFGISPATPAGTLYYTNFDEFTVGDDQWAGSNGWEGNNLGLGVHGIHENAIPNGGLLNTAFIGHRQPVSTSLHEHPLTATTLPVEFGSLAYEWLLGGSSPSDYGDNWMLIADTIVRNVGNDSRPPCFSSVACDATGATLTWHADNGFDYQVEHSNDLVNWINDLPGSSFLEITPARTLTFTDSSTTDTRRYYRLVRTHTP